jgi:KaiC/GvpD/RAD55 family RecA-like ATPase
VSGGLDDVEHLSATDNLVTGNGSFGMGIRSGDGYLYSVMSWAIAENMPVLETGLEHEGVYMEDGTFVSAPVDLGHPVEWGSINWSMVTPPGCAIMINVRASPDGVSWSPWSQDFDDNTGMDIPLGPDRYLQIKAVLSTTSGLVSPVLDRVDFNFSRFSDQGTIETEDLVVDGVLSWLELNFTGNGLGSVNWSYSLDSGSVWDPAPANGNLSGVAIGTGTLRIRAELSTNNTTIAPVVDEFSVSYVVNKVPWLIKAFDPVSFPEDSNLLEAYNLSQHFGDEGVLTFEGMTNSTNISFTVHENGSVDLATLSKDWYGQASITFRAEDEHGKSLEAEANITVTPVNDQPTIDSLPNIKVFAGETYSYQVVASDVDEDELTFTLEGPVSMAVNGTGHVSWVTDDSDLGYHPVSISVSDGFDTVWQNFTLMVERTTGNQAPVIVGINESLVFVGSAFTAQVTALDADNDTLRYELDGHPEGMSIDPSTGLIQWVPEDKDTGNVTLKVNVSDPFTYVTKDFIIRVLSSNTRPVIQGLDKITLKDEAIVINLTGHVEDGEEPSEDLAWRMESSSADLFTAELVGSELTLTPLEDVEGKRTIRLVVRDTGGMESDITLTVVVDNKKDVPPTFAEKMFSDYLLFWLLPMLLLVILVTIAIASRKTGPAPGAVEYKGRTHQPASVAIHQKPHPVEKVGGDEEVEPVAPPEEIKESEEIGKTTVYLITLLRTLIEKEVIVDGEPLSTALKSIAEKDERIDGADIDEEGRITLAPSEEASLDDVSKAYGRLLDAVLLAGHGLRGLKDRREKTIEVADDVLKGEKGPAARRLKLNILGGKLATDISTGIDGFDDFLGGGLPKGDAMLLQMPSGREKTQVALQMAKMGYENEQGVIVALSDISPEQFVSDAGKMGFDAVDAIGVGLLRIVDWNAYKTKRVRDVEEEGHVIRASKSLTNLMIAISDSMKKFEEEDTKRIILDVVSPAVNIFGIDSSYRFLQSLVARLKEGGFSSVFIVMKDMLEAEELGTISQNFDNVVDIERRREDKRIIWEAAVLSMSRAGYSSEVREIEFSKQGLVIK